MSIRRGAALLLGALLAFGAAAAFSGAALALTFTPGQNGHPTDGTMSDIGPTGSVTLQFQRNASIVCNANGGPTSVLINLDYRSANVASGSKLVIYLSPGQSAVSGDGAADPAAYIAQVESNYVVYTFPTTLTNGTGTITTTLNVTHAFMAVKGTVLAVVANAVDGQTWSTRSNAVGCAAVATGSPVVTPTPTPVTPTPTPVNPTPTPVTPTPTPTPLPSESIGGATATPVESVGGATGGPVVTPPPTGTAPDSGEGGSSPIFVLAIASMFGLAGLAAARAQRRSIYRS